MPTSHAVWTKVGAMTRTYSNPFGLILIYPSGLHFGVVHGQVPAVLLSQLETPSVHYCLLLGDMGSRGVRMGQQPSHSHCLFMSRSRVLFLSTSMSGFCWIEWVVIMRNHPLEHSPAFFQDQIQSQFPHCNLICISSKVRGSGPPSVLLPQA